MQQPESFYPTTGQQQKKKKRTQKTNNERIIPEMIGAFSVSLQESMSQEDGLANDAGELALWRTKYKKNTHEFRRLNAVRKRAVNDAHAPVS